MYHRSGNGYYHVWISAVKNHVFFKAPHDKAYFISLLQDALSPSSRLQEFPFLSNNLPIEIDLLAYSLTKNSVHLLIYTIRKQSIDELGQNLLSRYAQYVNQQTNYDALPFDTLFIFDYLAGPHEALNVSREIHLLHENWRYNRYSSIGFYLDDRRGEWMRLWRLARLYDNQPSLYLDYVKSVETESDKIFEFIQT